MRGNFSLTQFPASEKGSLLMQQGRPLLDSDWNAQIKLAEGAVSKKIQSLIGTSGAAVDSAGFKLTPLVGLLVNETQDKLAPPEGIFLLANDSLPFPVRDIPARPFHLQIGFTLSRMAAGGLCHVPGLFQLRITKENRLNITATSLKKGGLQKKMSVTGKHNIAVQKEVRVDIIFDGEYINIFLDNMQSTDPEVSLLVGNPEPLNFDPLGLILGCIQTAAAALDSDGKCSQDPIFSNPLAVTFWHFSIVEGFLEWARTMPLGCVYAADQEGLICSLDFSAIVADILIDRSAFNNNGLLRVGDKEPVLSLLTLVISQGDYIAYGRYYENPTSCLITNQPNLPAVPASDYTARSQESHFRRYYLDCWQRLVTDLEAPANHDPALGGIDTTASLRNIWQVKSVEACDAEAMSTCWQSLTKASDAAQITLRRKDDYLEIQNGLLRVEIHHSGWAENWPLAEAALPQALETTLIESNRQFVYVDSHPEADMLLQLDRPIVLFTAEMDTCISPDALEKSDHAFTTIIGIEKDGSGHRLSLAGAAPEIVKGQKLFILPVASFKFSTQNGCLAYPVSELVWESDQSDIAAALSFPGYNGMEIKNGDWLELRNLALDQTEQPGPMLMVKDFMLDRLELFLDAQPGFLSTCADPVALGEYPTLTIWGNSMAAAPAPAIVSGWIGLTAGIEIEFDLAGFYTSGQYWSAPLRSASPEGIIWPESAQGKPLAQAPEGPKHQYVPLADLIVQPICVETIDRRRLFRPLVDEPFADLDDKTARVLFETAHFMEMIGLPDWQLRREELPDFIREAIKHALVELYHSELRFIGTKPDAPRDFKATGQKLVVSRETDHEWHIGEEYPGDMQGDGYGGLLAGQPVYINQKDNGIWAYRGAMLGWELLTHVPDDRRAYSVAWDTERLYIVGGRRRGLLTDGAAKHVIALNSMGEWHTVGTMHHYTDYPAAVCTG
ncbi:MAG: hypothetical protein JKY60_08225, partial [Kordiimonadaceae bacterium]|nr:hypothetical protein [Kordiimonadaceae bacterium]